MINTYLECKEIHLEKKNTTKVDGSNNIRNNLIILSFSKYLSEGISN